MRRPVLARRVRRHRNAVQLAGRFKRVPIQRRRNLGSESRRRPKQRPPASARNAVPIRKVRRPGGRHRKRHLRRPRRSQRRRRPARGHRIKQCIKHRIILCPRTHMERAVLAPGKSPRISQILAGQRRAGIPSALPIPVHRHIERPAVRKRKRRPVAPHRKTPKRKWKWRLLLHKLRVAGAALRIKSLESALRRRIHDLRLAIRIRRHGRRIVPERRGALEHFIIEELARHARVAAERTRIERLPRHAFKRRRSPDAAAPPGTPDIAAADAADAAGARRAGRAAGAAGAGVVLADRLRAARARDRQEKRAERQRRRKKQSRSKRSAQHHAVIGGQPDARVNEAPQGPRANPRDKPRRPRD